MLDLRRHISDRELVRVADDATTVRSLSDRQQSHLAGCPSCADRLEAHRAIGRALAGDWSPQRLPAGARARGRSAGVGAVSAGTAAVVVALVLVAVVQRGPIVPGGPASGTGSAPASAPSPGSIGSVGAAMTVSGFRAAAWSPDGAYLALAGDRLEVVDRAGTHVAWITASVAAWVDGTSLLAWTANPGDPSRGSVALVDVRGPVSTPIAGSFGPTLVSNGHGRVALPIAGDGTAAPAFVVWSAGSVGSSLPGVVLGWSPDGGQLVVATPAGESSAPAGSPDAATVSVLAGDALRTRMLMEGYQVDARYPVVFRPDGQQFAAPCGWSLGAAPVCHQIVVDVTTGKVTVVGADAPGLPLAWDRSGRLLLAAAAYPDAGPLREWTGDQVVSSSLGFGSYGLWSPTGDAAVTTIGSDGPAITVVSATTGQPALTVAGSLTPGSWAPDGSGGFTIDGNPPDVVVRLLTVR